jgi:RHS repeat-associated protein
MKLKHLFLRVFLVSMFLLLIPWQANAALSKLDDFFPDIFPITGHFSISVDAGGSNDSFHTIEVEKPNDDATVHKAFVLAASHSFYTFPEKRTINDGDITINGNPIIWNERFFQDIPFENNEKFFNNVLADVTDIVKPIVDDAPADERFKFTFTEVGTYDISGEILVVIFNDPTAPKQTISLFFGGQKVKGETFVITLAEPINPSVDGSKADFGLGMSYGGQNDVEINFTNVKVNSIEVSASAGGGDDTHAKVHGPGTLITVGGLDDSIENPPRESDGKPIPANRNPRTDDELYSLLPFVSPNDTSISVFTENPSNDDDIFFAYFVLSGTAIVNGGILLKPDSANNEVGDTHTVIAVVKNENGEPVSDRLVNFEILEGSPNAGITYSATTDANGEAYFTYTVNKCMGDDQIKASFTKPDSVDQEESIVVLNIPSFPPTANFTLIPIPVYVGSTINLDGSSSVTACATESIVEHKWQSSDGQPIPLGGNSSIIYTQPSDYQITLTVTDNLGGTHSTQKSITVLEPPPPVAKFIATPMSGFTPLTVMLDGSLSTTSYDGGTITNYQWQSSNEQPIAPGANSSITYTQPGDYQITLTVTDNLGGTHSTPQLIRGSIKNPDALMAFLQDSGAESININDRAISFIIAGETHRGLLAEQVTPGTSVGNNSLEYKPIDDLNNDGIEDLLITYPSGDQQLFYYFGTGTEPSQEALKRYIEETFGAEAVVINADGSVSLTINGETYQGQLDAEIIPGTPSSGFLVTINIGDVNGDGVDDFEITYPSGERQNLYYFGEPPELLLTVPPISTTEISTPASMTEFLYTGDDPIQTEVVEGTIDPDKLAVLRGRVTNRDGQPLSEVTIDILNRAEFGKTRTLSDGTFSLAVNGGESFTIKYTKDGYLSAQRQVNTETQGFFWAADVILTPIERSQGPTVDLSAANTEPMQVVQGPKVKSNFELNTDPDRPSSSRQPTLFFPQGTTATLADGNQLDKLDELDILITEYTINDNDLAAMPTPLPPGTGYTYAVNISANGRTDVQLSRPIPFYVDNFLGFPTGTNVPIGRLDENAESGWVPAADGRVIKILSIDNGIATLDTNGDGLADNELGITDAERREIATQFPNGGETVASGENAGDFWRVEINQLGDFDLNWPLKDPDKPNAKEGSVDPTSSQVAENTSECQGCIIEPESQVLGETIPVVGVPFNLNYRSSRTPGRNADYQLDIPLQDNFVLTPKRIKLEVSIGGQKISRIFSDDPADNPEGPLSTPRYTYEWDAKDGYGRSLHGQGRHKATVRIGYVYNGEYEVPPEITQSLIDVQCSTENPEGSFGCISATDSISSGIQARQEVIGWQEYTINIGSWFPQNAGLGGWTLDIHHTYDPNDEVLYFGNGRQRQVAPIKQDGKILIASEDGGLVYEFNRNGRHQRTIDSLTNKAIYTFSYLNDYLVAIEDIDGDITTIERDANNAPLAIIAPYGQRTVLTLDANGYLATVKNPAAELHQMVYTADGLLTQYTNPRNHVANYEYDNLGFLIEDVDVVGGGWKLARTENPEVNGYLVTMTSKEGRVSGFNVATLDDGTFQRVTSAPDGTKTIVTRKTEDNNKLTISERADGTKITLEEGPESGRFGMQAPLATNLQVETPNGLISTITTERIAELEDENNPLSLQKLTEKVTVNGHTSSSIYDVSAKKITATSAAGRESVSYLDDNGRVIREQTPNLADVHSSYDERGRLVETRVGDGLDARSATISYNNNGYISEVTDAMDRTVSFTYDAVGRVETQTLVDGRKIQYSYDANGNVTSITPPGRPAHDFAYTPMDLQSQYTPPALTDVSEPQTEYEYNLDKQLLGITRPDGRAVTFDYDVTKGRLNAMTLPSGQLSYKYADTGNLDSIVSPDDSMLMYTYDGSLAVSETWGAGSPVLGRVSLTYDNDFRVTTSQVNGRHTVNYEYDADGLLISSGFLALNYHPQTGFLTDTRLGDLTTQRVYNSFAEMENVTAAYDESVLYQSEYGYDKLGRITQKTETIEGDEITYAYGYDDAGRLVAVTEDGAVTDEYSYDDNGNRLSADTGNGFFAGNYDEQDRLVQYGDTVYKYTANGELLSKDSGGVSTEYEYDVLGNLRNVKLPNKEIEYIIDARNRRIGKRVEGKFTQGFLYQGSLNPIAELGVSGDVVTRFVYGSKANVPDYMLKGEKIYRILSDHLGSPRLVVDISDGTVVQRMDYDVFGNVVLDTNPGFQPFGFAGGLYDVDTGLVRFGARDYDPEIGRWTAKDPILFDGGDTNLYGYVLGDPVNLVDPLGNFAFGGAIIGGIIGGISGYISTGNWQGALGGAAIGAASGFFGQFGTSWYAGAAIGSVVGGGSNLAWQLGVENKNWECLDWWETGKSTLLGGIMGGFSGYGTGRQGLEYSGQNWRLNPWGSSTGRWFERMPHYHRRVLDAQGSTLPGQGIRWHRPWQKF